ncbi:tRNA pseudouridine(38-40) synthase TruA [candidate division WOR-3 bacterium RBG_13_43_14]|uniref:tRNA pseudouridine synthase A n=1 Tax=candidate division WOR-3 bacterium RBG_13_43_14 TaxID=1802590 RepID=A0A1F4UAQ9_UNCW3|nr:MAG: tRNA pseudouridine(38-40) synthase TruA [candidate division WOR-3 bacterium RBG_13_43_14]
MRNVRLVIEYDGSDFNGWQYQPEQRTVQGELESAIEKITTETIRLTGAGRTDRGVHAFGQVANFLTASNLKLDRMQKAINGLTGDDVYIRQIDEVPIEFHSRYSALNKTYRYRIIFEPLPLLLRYNWYVKYRLDITRMSKAIESLHGIHDFKFFSMLTDKKNTECNVFQLDLTPEETGCIITIKANRFLHKMVRGLVGFLCDIGRNRYRPDDVHLVFKGKIKDIYFAPPQGLYLLKIDY